MCNSTPMNSIMISASILNFRRKEISKYGNIKAHYFESYIDSSVACTAYLNQDILSEKYFLQTYRETVAKRCA